MQQGAKIIQTDFMIEGVTIKTPSWEELFGLSWEEIKIQRKLFLRMYYLMDRQQKDEGNHTDEINELKRQITTEAKRSAPKVENKINRTK